MNFKKMNYFKISDLFLHSNVLLVKSQFIQVLNT